MVVRFFGLFGRFTRPDYQNGHTWLGGPGFHFAFVLRHLYPATGPLHTDLGCCPGKCSGLGVFLVDKNGKHI